MTEDQADTLILQNQIIIAMLHAQILATGNPAAMVVANKQMELNNQLNEGLQK